MADNETKELPELKANYLKDLSFETPAGANILRVEWEPVLQTKIGLSASRLDIHAWEVVLMLEITVNIKELTVILIEAHQAGVFIAKGMDLESLRNFVAEDVPALLFPDLTETIRVLCRSGGFPGIEFEPLDFSKGFFKMNAEAFRQPGEKIQAPIADL
jgi:preprotein translocase subunit SecB